MRPDTADTPFDYAIVSDLHLAEGKNPETGRISRWENFFSDEAFERMLSRLRDLARDRGRPRILIINGDCIDFLRVTSIPQPAAIPKGFPSISPTKQKYGLGTSPAESKWQLERVLAGHPVFFRGLARFLLAGHRLVIVKGNHDVNWLWPEVRYRFLESMEGFLREEGSRQSLTEPEISSALDRIEIRPWVYYVKDLLYVEHGNQYDPVNAFRHFLYPLLLDPDSPIDRYEIDLPFGSFFTRYFFNKLESQDATAPNYLHPASYFSTLWGRQFYVVWNVVKNYLPYFFRTIRKVSHREGGRYREIRDHHWRLVRETGEEYGNPKLFQEIAGFHQPPAHDSRSEFLSHALKKPLRKVGTAIGGLFLLSFFWSFLSEWIAHSPLNLLLRTTLSLVTAYGFIFVGLLWILFSLKPTREGASYREAEPGVLRAGAARIAHLLNVPYIAFGHSHQEDIWRVPGRNTWYFNTGTWTPVLDAEHRVVRPQVHFPVLLVESGQARLSRWNDAAREFDDLPVLSEPAPA
ncbi:MAG: hypothetical protein AB1640_25680 [bacterium]